MEGPCWLNFLFYCFSRFAFAFFWIFSFPVNLKTSFFGHGRFSNASAFPVFRPIRPAGKPAASAAEPSALTRLKICFRESSGLHCCLFVKVPFVRLSRRNSVIIARVLSFVKTFFHFFFFFSKTAARFPRWNLIISCPVLFVNKFFHLFYILFAWRLWAKKRNLNLSRFFFLIYGRWTEKEGFEPSRRVNDLHP